MRHKSILISMGLVIGALVASVAAAQVAAAHPAAQMATPNTDAVVQPPCDEAAFVTALNAVNNGTLTFNCGGQKTITFTSQKTLAAGKNVTIDGGGAITLSGGFFHRLFVVNAGASLTLSNITAWFAGGEAYSDAGGAIQNMGTLIVRNSRFVGNLTGANYGGGAIYSHGALVVEGSVFESNSAGAGGAIYTQKITGAPGTLIISNTQFISNTSVNYYGGGIANLGWLTMTNVLLQGNLDKATTTSGHGGAGLANYPAGTAVLKDVTFSQNAVLSSTDIGGGGIANWGVLMMTGGLVVQNRSTFGGGICNDGNTGGPGKLSLTGVTISGNSATYGGGMDNYYGTATLTNVTLSGNSATSGGGMYNSDTATLTNVTLSGNSATSGGGIYNWDLAQLVNVTLSGNSATSGGGIYNKSGYTVTLKNSIVAYSPQGGNCGGAALTNNHSDRYSLSSDNTCVLAGTGSKNNTDPLLTALGDYGGPTKVHMLKTGSPAINGVAGSDAPSTDQRGKPRPQGGGYDIGAVERQPDDADVIPSVYLPLVLR